ncbi:DUF1294 domain-containing protein [Clostridium gasigenes]|uniref:DUF1294 domain-containing protein n=1 Tax=Clostridium gasigenes TaxID=94869 RepID=UPI0014385FC3|nr:DUF1294 domain-containing protein [Clostridium gasigenes]MBB6623882.1 DUF1294 domain-containing protein [Clostridium gasigenes]MBU3087428.1 DUF1294 domain-containing protein [Clostridium gasigenes]MBU3131643.1 DUF1294 domain-containing protein [Clostridium gasigenes]MBU3135118.1 DUF1294 domain-containing protein [Clostridium gasigenes]NKF05404.1 DUF1294 domain-containing protein [Clostridium gasigenes]
MQTLILLYLSIINLVGFLLMLVDKRRAIKHEWRISELNLFIVSIIGGSIGSYLGMHCFRHKTKSLKFTLGIPIIILIQGYLAIIL